jgi:hypothetical protein
MLAPDPQALENNDLYAYEHPWFGSLKVIGPVADFSTTGSVLLSPGQRGLDSLPRPSWPALVHC